MHMPVPWTSWHMPLFRFNYSAPQVTIQQPQQQQQPGCWVCLSTNAGCETAWRWLYDCYCTAADFKSWKQTWDDYYKVNQVGNCPEGENGCFSSDVHYHHTQQSDAHVSSGQKEKRPAIGTSKKAYGSQGECSYQTQKFAGHAQRSVESVGKYVLALRHLAKDAEFGDGLNEMIKQQVSICVKSAYFTLPPFTNMNTKSAQNNFTLQSLGTAYTFPPLGCSLEDFRRENFEFGRILIWKKVNFQYIIKWRKKALRLYSIWGAFPAE